MVKIGYVTSGKELGEDQTGSLLEFAGSRSVRERLSPADDLALQWGDVWAGAGRVSTARCCVSIRRRHLVIAAGIAMCVLKRVLFAIHDNAYGSASPRGVRV
jgi:hypothetical protein